MEDNQLRVYNITVPITKPELTLSVRGDFHYGVRGVDKNEMIKVFEREQDQHRDNQFVLYTGDITENNLNNSVGHGYDIEIRDPAQQITDMRDAMVRLQKHLYGNSAFHKLNTKGPVLSAGVVGNHEYRSRNAAGIWLQEQMYGPAKVLDMKVQGLINLKIVNKRLKMEKTYRIFVAHRPNNSNATSVEMILRSIKKKKADIAADLYVFGHYHRRLIYADGAYDQDGNFKKVMFAVNPAPVSYMEYADWSGFSPLGSAWYVNVKLPLDGNCWGKV